MNSSLKSRLALFAPAIALLGAVACSSSSGGGGTPSAGNDAGSGGDTPLKMGMGDPCAAEAAKPMHVTATKIKVTAKWKQTVATAMGMDELDIWLLTKFSVNGQNVMGTVKTCGNKTPVVVLTPMGATAEGADGKTAKVQITIPSSVWDSPDIPLTMITGTTGGFAVGSSLLINEAVTLDGLSPMSTYANAATPWPMQGASIAAQDIVDADRNGAPGILALPVNNMDGFYLPSTGLDSTAPKADQLGVVLRTTLSLYGTSSTCTDSAGVANVTELNNHVVACRIAGTGEACNADEYNFIDFNTTQYESTGATYQMKMLDNENATCADVLAALP